MVTDAEEGLILVNVDTLADGEPRNNFLQARGDLERGRRARTARATSRSAGHYRLYRRRRRAGGGRPGRSAPPAARRASSRSRDARAIGAPVPLSLGDRRRGAEAVRRHPSRRVRCRAAGARCRSPTRGASMSPAPMPMSRRRREGLVIVDVDQARAADDLPERRLSAGSMNDAQDVVVGSTNASLFAYVADGRNGHEGDPAHLARRASPISTASRRAPKPELIAWAQTPLAGAGAVQGPRPRPRGRRDRRPDRGLRPPRLAALHPRRDGAPVPQQPRRAVQGARHRHDGGLGAVIRIGTAGAAAFTARRFARRGAASYRTSGEARRSPASPPSDRRSWRRRSRARLPRPRPPMAGPARTSARRS